MLRAPLALVLLLAVSCEGTKSLPLSSFTSQLDDTVDIVKKEVRKGEAEIEAAGKQLHSKEAESIKYLRSWFVASVSIALCVKALCVFSNVLAQVSPLPQVFEFHKLRNTGDADSAPFVTILYSGVQWCFYGVYAYLLTGRSGFLILVWSNVVGAVLGCYYVYGFYRNCRCPGARKQLELYCLVTIVVTVVQATALCFMENQEALFLCGLMSSICSILAAFAMLSTLPLVIQSKCSSSINVELLFAATASSVLWLICGAMLMDVWVMINNFVSLLAQIMGVLAVVYYPREPSDVESSSLERKLSVMAKEANSPSYGAAGETGCTADDAI